MVDRRNAETAVVENGYPLAVVVRVGALRPHPDADRLDILWVDWPSAPNVGGYNCGARVVTGKHYRAGQLGILILPPALLPGWLAEDLWLFGRKRAHEEPLFQVKEVELRGEVSEGLFCGQTYAKDYTDQRSIDLTAQRLQQGATDLGGGALISWPMWRDHWKPGDDVTTYLGIRLLSSVAEHRLFKPEVAAVSPDTDLGSTPAAGSLS